MFEPTILAPTIVAPTHAHDAVAAAGAGEAAYLAGGTTLVDLMKLGLVAPQLLVSLHALGAEHARICVDGDTMRVGALARMSDVAADPEIGRRCPAIRQALLQAASPQIRNMATIGGNLLQRTRCSSFRYEASACNKRRPGSGCAARDGDRRGLAVLGTSGACIANYPGDLAVALVALDAGVEILAADGSVRHVAIEDLYRLPEDTPEQETTLSAGDLLTQVVIPDQGWDTSLYVKIRDRASYAFALASAAIALRVDGDGVVDTIRIVVGGLAARPWRSRAAERSLLGGTIGDATARAAAEIAFEAASTDPRDAAMVELGRRTVERALLAAASEARRARAS